MFIVMLIKEESTGLLTVFFRYFWANLNYVEIPQDI